jgi:hypothetical protein
MNDASEGRCDALSGIVAALRSGEAERSIARRFLPPERCERAVEDPRARP